MRTILFSLVMCIAACGVNTGDSSVYLTGTEQGYITGANGQKTCAGHKVLICHIPPGNPANAHTICVDHNAVQPHVQQHGDTIGACASEPNPPPNDPPPPPPDAGTGGGGGSGSSGSGGTIG
jgi:hypothetical protein